MSHNTIIIEAGVNDERSSSRRYIDLYSFIVTRGGVIISQFLDPVSIASFGYNPLFGLNLVSISTLGYNIYESSVQEDQQGSGGSRRLIEIDSVLIEIDEQQQSQVARKLIPIPSYSVDSTQPPSNPIRKNTIELDSITI